MGSLTLEERKLSSAAGAASDLVFSPDGSRVAFVEAQGTSFRVVINDEPGETYDEVRAPFFNADGSLCVYGARRDQGWYVVVNGKPGDRYEELGRIGLDADEREIYYFGKVLGFVWCYGGGERRQAGARFGSVMDGPAWSRDLRVFTHRRNARGVPLFRRYPDQGGAEFDEIGLVVPSADEQRLAFTGRKAGRWYVVLGDRKRGPFDGVASLQWTPDGQSLAFHVRTGWKWYSVVGEKSGPPFDEVVGPYWSRDGAHVAYEARIGTKWCVVQDGRPGPMYQWVMHHSVQYSPDGTVCVYEAGERDSHFIVANGKKGEGADSVRNITFSPESVMAYVANYGKRQRLMLGDGPGPEHEQISFLGFDSSGRQVWYVARDRGAWYILEGDRRHGPYDEVGFEGDASRGQVAVRVRHDKKWRLYQGGDPGAPYDEIAQVTRVPKLSTFAYVGRAGGRSRVVVGDREGEAFDEIRRLTVSPDGATLAYLAREGEAWFPVVGAARLGDGYGRVVEMRFSPDGRRIHWGAQLGGDVWWKTADLAQSLVPSP